MTTDKELAQRLANLTARLDAALKSDGPPRGVPRYKFYCPSCQRTGTQAWQNVFFPERVIDPETFTCPDCNVKVEILGREDQ